MEYANTYVEINLDAIEQNFRAVLDRAQGPVMAVVKADAYGHGAVPVARTLEPLCAFFGVAAVAEALELAKALKGEGYEVASYSGYTFEQLLHGTSAQKELLGSIDVLIDGPFLRAEKSLEIAFRGSRNQRILDVKKSLAAGKAVETTSKRWLGEY